ncbi:FAD4 [Auxenochlorella protothecoides x Auxenochlorella symbiontica]
MSLVHGAYHTPLMALSPGMGGHCRSVRMERRVSPSAVLQSPPAPAKTRSRPPSPRKMRMPTEPSDLVHFESTLEHRAWVYGTMGLLMGSVGIAGTHTDSPGEVLALLASCVASYYAADFVSGVVHWGLDNYGDGDTPFFGSQIAAFQGHHSEPWTITQRAFANNVHKVFKPATAPALVLLAAAPFTPSWLTTFGASLLLLLCLSQQTHAWAHKKPSQLPAAVLALQDAGVIVSCKVHGAHHRPPFEGNYCIVSGVWNPILDGDGSDQGFFRRLERIVQAATGVKPRCWTDPEGFAGTPEGDQDT